jgi:hypothetical protein
VAFNTFVKYMSIEGGYFGLNFGMFFADLRGLSIALLRVSAGDRGRPLYLFESLVALREH